MPRVLIVDDDHDIRLSVRTVFEQMADDVTYSVAEAANGQEALDRLRATAEPAVVLFDLVMPVMDGQPFLRMALADPDLAARCAFICFPATLSHVTPDLAAVLNIHSIPILAKPFDLDHLLAVVAQSAARLPALRS